MHQIKLDKAKNLATIDLNSFFYPLHLVQWSAAEFGNVAKISIRKAGSRVIVSVKPSGKEKAEQTALHFCNFVLSLKREFGQHA